MSKCALRHLPEHNWPASDGNHFAAAFRTPKDYFDDCATGHHLRPATRTAILYGYRRWLGFLSSYDPHLLDLPPADRITRDLVHAYVHHLRETSAARSIATRIRHLHDAARFMYPQRDWTWLRRLRARLERAVPTAPRKPFLITSQRLIDAALADLDAIDREFCICSDARSSTKRRILAQRYRDDLLVAIAGFMPLRRTNLAQLMIGTTLIRSSSGWRIDLPGESVKNGEPIVADLPAWLGDRVDRYVNTYWSFFYRSSAHAGLWATAKGCPADPATLYRAFQESVMRLVNIRMSLHDVRRVAATTWAVHDPVNAAGAKDLLADRSDRIFNQHYNIANGIRASRVIAQQIESIRSTGKK